MIAQNLRKWGSVEAKEAKTSKEQKGMISDSRLSDMLVYIKNTDGKISYNNQGNLNIHSIEKH